MCVEVGTERRHREASVSLLSLRAGKIYHIRRLLVKWTAEMCCIDTARHIKWIEAPALKRSRELLLLKIFAMFATAF